MRKRRGYSVKPGRANSAELVLGGVFGLIFSIFWTYMAISSNAPFIFPLFGVMFIIMMIVNIVKSYKNATGDNRYSEYDVVRMEDEPDPWDERFRRTTSDSNYELKENNQSEYTTNDTTEFCPYCGAKAEKDYQFCRKCGRTLPH